jgi:hypothetical protein
MGSRKPDRDDTRDAFGSQRSDMRTPVKMKEAANRGGLIASIGRGLDVWSLKTWIGWRHFVVQLILEIGRPLDQDGC